jgi:hypothetical protein
MSSQDDTSFNTQGSTESYGNDNDYLYQEDDYEYSPSDYSDYPGADDYPEPDVLHEEEHYYDDYYDEPYTSRFDDYWGDNRIRYDSIRPYNVIHPTHLTLETISFHIGRATGFADEFNREHEIGLLVQMMARTFKEYDVPTRRELMKAIFAFFTMEECTDSNIENILYLFIAERGLNFKLMLEVLDVLENLDDNSYWICVLMCALEWTKSERMSQKHANQLRHFTEMLDEVLLEKYFEGLHFWSDDEEHTKFLITKVFYDWVRDYDFQVNFFAWLFDHQFSRSYKYFSSTYGFYRDVVVEGIPYVCATTPRNTERLHDMWDMMCDDYDLHDETINIVFQFIEMVSSQPEKIIYGKNYIWSDLVDTLFPIIRSQLSHKDFNLFLCETMRRLMGKNNFVLVQKLRRMYFAHLSDVRIATFFLNWCDFEFPLPGLFTSFLNTMSQANRDKVFTAICVNDNIRAAQWIISKTFTWTYTFTVADEKIVAFGITHEPPLDLSFLDIVIDSPLCRFGFTAKNSRTLKNKMEECVVCMEPLESTVVLNCHPTHQICESCCDRMMRMNQINKCPLCRGSVRPSDCCVYV